jgi:RND family efflux transporter MFP subunit
MEKMKNYKWLIGLGVVIGGGIMYAGLSLITRNTQAETNAINEKGVKVMMVSAKPFAAEGEYAGFVRGIDQAMVTTKINGRILSLNKREGDWVRKGEVLAVLSADELAAQTQSARDSITALQNTLQDTKKYYSQKVDEAKDNNATKEEVQSAKRMRDLQMQSVQTQIVNAQGSLKVAQSYAGETIVRAPFSGVVTRVFQEVGQVVGPTAPICEVADATQLSVEMFVSQMVAEQLKKGDKISLLCGEEKKECQGMIDAISPISEANAQKSLVRIRFVAKDPLVYLGQYVIAKLAMSDDSIKIVVPEQAIISKYNEKFVFVAEAGLAKERKIVTGQSHSGLVAVSSGLAEGEQLIVEGMYALRNNDNVKTHE